MEIFESTPGVYQIVNIATEEIYVGSSVHINTRINAHIAAFKRGDHRNKHLQNVFNKYGLDIFRFEVLEYCTKVDVLEREQYWIDTLHPEYNKVLTAQCLAMNTKLDEDDVQEILASLGRGESCKSIAQRYGVHFSTIYLIKNKAGIRGWRNSKISLVKARRIRTLLDTRTRVTRNHLRQVADHLGVSIDCIYAVYTNRTWKEA